MNDLSTYTVLFEASCCSLSRSSNSTGGYNFSRAQKKYGGNEAVVKILQYRSTGRFAVKIFKVHGTKQDILMACINSKVPHPAISQANDCAVHCFVGDQSAWKDFQRLFIIEFVNKEDAEEYTRLINQIINLADGEGLNEDVPFEWFCIFDQNVENEDIEEDENFHPSAFLEDDDDNSIIDDDTINDDDCESNEEEELPMTQPFPEPPLYPDFNFE